MGLKEKIFGKNHKLKENTTYEYFKMLNGYTPVFTNYEGGLYEMELTRQAVKSFATHCSKLTPEVKGTAAQRLANTLNFRPNFLMNTSQFIARIATIFEIDNNVFIVPIESREGKIIGYFPLVPANCEILDVEGEMYLRYMFSNGEYEAIEFERVGILTQCQYKDDVFGEDNSTLNTTMQLMHTTDEGIINAVKNSASIRFMARMGNFLKDEDLANEREKFAENNLSSQNKTGLLIFDNKFGDVKQVVSKPYLIDDKQMQQIKENVYIHFGTNEKILQNKFNEEEWNAYYEGKIEPFAIQLSLALSNMTFSEREMALGNKIYFSSNRLQYASNSTKLQVSTQLFDRALLNRNGVMDIWNMPYVEGGEKYYIRKEYAEVSKLDSSVSETDTSKEGSEENA